MDVNEKGTIPTIRMDDTVKLQSFSSILNNPGLNDLGHFNVFDTFYLDDLAFEDVDGLIKRLGAISELMRLTDWIRLAKEQDQASSEAA